MAGVDLAPTHPVFATLDNAFHELTKYVVARRYHDPKDRCSQKRNDDNQKSFASAVEVAEQLKPDDPLFCFSASQLTARAKVFLSGFPGEVTFAVKSNPSIQVIKTLAAAGVKAWDVASVYEMALVSRAHRPDALSLP